MSLNFNTIRELVKAPSRFDVMRMILRGEIIPEGNEKTDNDKEKDTPLGKLFGKFNLNG